MMGRGNGKAIFYAAALAMLLPAALEAQTQTAAPANQSNASSSASPQDETTITIFGKPKSRVSADGLTTIDLSKSASGCGFMSRTPDQDVIDNYFDDMYGGDDVDSNGAAPTAGSGRQRVNANSPYGDASTPDASQPMAGSDTGDDTGSVGISGECTQSETNFALGRATIYAHDHSLKDAFAALDAKDYPKALELFKKAYEKLGDYPEYDVAALTVGKMYLYGIGTPRDTNQAIAWLKKTFLRPVNPFGPERQTFRPEDPDAMNARSEAYITLAQIYMIGRGVPRNPAEAVHWYKTADEWGYVPATHIVGRAYRSGYGVTKDVKKAVDYFKRASDAGYAPSQYALGEIYYLGDEGVAQDKVKAGAYLLAAAQKGDPNALYAMGRLYELGEGGASVDPAKALVYYKEAALKGQADAQNELGIAFYTGDGVPKDETTARKWFQAAAEKGNSEAMFNLASMLTKGEGGPKDLVRAYAWFALANRAGADKADVAMKQVAAQMTPEQRAQAEALIGPPQKAK
jgi:TPR repeat protein